MVNARRICELRHCSKKIFLNTFVDLDLRRLPPQALLLRPLPAEVGDNRLALAVTVLGGNQWQLW